MTMSAHDEHDDRDQRPRPLYGLGPRLRREALETRPAFSPEFQARLVAGLEACPSRPTPPAGVAAAAEPKGRTGWRPLAAIAAGVAVAAAVAVVLPGSQPVTPGAGEGPAAAMLAGQVAPDAPQPAEPPAVMVLPLYDEIEAGLRDGVRTLAESFVELPDWASLAEFDAAALLGAAIGPE